MALMTEQEAWELDDFVTNNEIELGPNGSGFLSQREASLKELDTLSFTYLTTDAQADNTTPAKIIGEMVRERIAATA
jgi:hypothetical protein